MHAVPLRTSGPVNFIIIFARFSEQSEQRLKLLFTFTLSKNYNFSMPKIGINYIRSDSQGVNSVTVRGDSL